MNINMNQTLSQYTNSIQTSTQESNFNFSLLFSVIIFLAVGAFVFVYIRNFIKGYQSQDINSEENIKSHSMNENQNNSVVYCNTCGQENDFDSKFCKNCGSRLR